MSMQEVLLPGDKQEQRCVHAAAGGALPLAGRLWGYMARCQFMVALPQFACCDVGGMEHAALRSLSRSLIVSPAAGLARLASMCIALAALAHARERGAV